MNEETKIPPRHDYRILGVFLLGALIGSLVIFGVTSLRETRSVDSTAIRAAVRDELRAIDIKDMVRQGALEAIREDQQRAEADAVTADSGNTVIGPQLPKLTAQPQVSGVQVPLGNNILGDKNAPVVMIEYSDFQ